MIRPALIHEATERALSFAYAGSSTAQASIILQSGHNPTNEGVAALSSSVLFDIDLPLCCIPEQHKTNISARLLQVSFP
jgi:hypothetical protein